MDERRIDDLAKLASAAVSRRSAMKVLFGGAAGAVLSGLGIGSASASPPGHVELPPQARPPHGGGDCCPPDHPRLCGLSCIDPSTDPSNCGGCGVTCTDNQVCEAGICVGEPCPVGQTMCNDVCIDLDTDANNCGTCGETCHFGEACIDGVCVQIGCDPGLTECNGICVDLITDPQNCGSCGHACQSSGPCLSVACSAGVCVDVPANNGAGCDINGITGVCTNGVCVSLGDCIPGEQRACGSSVGACLPGTQTCQSNGTWGTCEGGIGPGIEVCNGLDDDCNGVVDDVDPALLQSDPQNCGSCGNVCAGGESCVDGQCAAVVDCEDIDCNDGIDCTIDTCFDGACSHTPDDSQCVDFSECTIGVCDPEFGCIQVAVSDGTVCTAGICMSGVCTTT